MGNEGSFSHFQTEDTETGATMRKHFYLLRDGSSAGTIDAYHANLDPAWAARSRVRRFKSVIFRVLQDVDTNRPKLLACMLLVIDGVILWPVLFSLKVDGRLSASWMATWVPLWIWDAVGLAFLSILVGWGNLQLPDDMDKHWEDSFPLHRRVLELVLWVLLILFQVFLVAKLDGVIGWSWSAVMAPLMAWASLRLVQRLHTLIAENVLVQAQLVVIMLKVEGEVTWNWWWVFTPVWLGLTTQVLRCFWSDCFISRLTSRHGEEDLESDEDQDQMEQAVAILSVQKKSLKSVGDLVLPLVTCVLLVQVLNGCIASTFVIFIPVVVVTATGLLAASPSLSCCCCCYLPSRRGRNGRVQPSPDAVAVPERAFSDDAAEPMLWRS